METVQVNEELLEIVSSKSQILAPLPPQDIYVPEAASAHNFDPFAAISKTGRSVVKSLSSKLEALGSDFMVTLPKIIIYVLFLERRRRRRKI
jgi:hypothetical protein